MTTREIESLQEFVLQAHRRCVNVPTTIGGSKSIHVGVVDSVYEVPESSDGSYDVVNRKCCIDTDDTRQNPHGYLVFDILRYFGYGNDFSFYQAVDWRGNVSIDAFADAIRVAIEHDVDILNLSVGKYMRGCRGYCQFCNSVSRAIAKDISVVAAAGNQHPKRTPEQVYCPATREATIAVAGMVTNCPSSIEQNNSVMKDGTNSEGPYWIKKQDGVDYSLDAEGGVFCGRRVCSNGEQCLQRNEERAWERNVRPKLNKPDIVAPVHYPHLEERVPVLLAGTSFAAPVVSGTLATICSELVTSEAGFPAPDKVKRAVLDGAAPIEGTDLRKLNVTGTLERMLE